MRNTSKLAIHGGTPVRDTYLPYGRQWIEEDDIKAVVDVLKGDYLTTGPTITQFEQQIAEYVGAKYAVSFSSGTAALHGACFAAEISLDDEVITTPMTFAATANCVIYQGGKPNFADIDLKTYNIDPNCLKNLITPKTKAIIVVHFTGQPADLDSILNIAKEHNLIVIEDAAHALGAAYKGKKVGSIGDMTMFSFHPVKHITTGEGGIITTNSERFYKKLIQFRTHGITREETQITDFHGQWYYEMQVLGYNYRLTDIQAALGISQLKKLERFIELRKRYVNMYNEGLKDVAQIRLPYEAKGYNSSWHLYIIRLIQDQLRASRKEVFEALQKENIGVNVHYIPLYTLPYYQQIGYQKGLCPNAEKIYEEMITIPLFPKMSEKDVNDVIQAVKKVVSFYAI